MYAFRRTNTWIWSTPAEDSKEIDLKLYINMQINYEMYTCHP